MVYLNTINLHGQVQAEPATQTFESKFSDGIDVVVDFEIRTGPDPRVRDKESEAAKRSDVVIEVKCRGRLAKQLVKTPLRCGDYIVVNGELRERFYRPKRGRHMIKVYYVDVDRLSVVTPPHGRFQPGKRYVDNDEWKRLKALERLSSQWSFNKDQIQQLADIAEQIDSEDP